MSDDVVVTEAYVDVQIDEVSRADGRAIVDQAAQKWLGISGETFLSSWQAGAFRDDDDPNIARVAVLIPFAQ